MFKASSSRVSIGFRVVENGKSYFRRYSSSTEAGAGKSTSASTSAAKASPPHPLPLNPPPPPPRKGHTGKILSILGVSIVGGTVGYAWYDKDFSQMLQNKSGAPIEDYMKSLRKMTVKEPPKTEIPSKYRPITPVAPDTPVTEKKTKEEKTIPHVTIPTARDEEARRKEKAEKERKEKEKKERESKEKEQMEKQKEKAKTERRLKEKEEDANASNAALEVIMENLVDTNTKLTKAVVEAQNKVIDLTQKHTETLKKAMNDTSEILNKDKQWEEVADIYSLREEAVKEAQKLKDSAIENLTKLQKAVEEGKQDPITKKNQILKTSQEKWNKLNREMDDVATKVEKVASESRVVSKYKDLVEKGRKQFQKELESIMPDVKLGEKGKKLTEDELNSMIAHAHRRIEQLQKQLAEQLAVESKKIEKALEIQHSEDEQLIENRVNSERRRLREQFKLERERWNEDSQVEFEQELRHYLARQAAAHSDHLKDVLKNQEAELAQYFEREMHTRLIEERQSFQSEVAGWIARLQGIEAAVDARAENERTAHTAQELWLACIAMNGLIRLGKEDGKTMEDKLKPLASEAEAISKAAGNHPFVQAVLKTVPDEALNRGVYTEDSLKQRFPKVKKVCRRVAMIDENGGTLFRYFLSYVQSFFMFDSVYATSLNNNIYIGYLDTFTILSHSDYFLQRGDLLQALRFMNQLQGEPRKVAADWIKEAQLLLETQQASFALTSFASASGLGTIF